MISTAGIFQSPSTQDPSSTFQITASYPGFGNILNVTLTAQTILAGQVVTGNLMPFGATVLPYGTQGTTGTGGTGTYALSVASDPIGSETMTVTLSPFGQAGPSSLWYQTDTTYLYNRNTANNGWNFIGPVNVNYLGLLPRAGGVLTNPITGSTGLMTKDGLTPFSGVPYINSKNSLAATMADLAEAQINLEEQITASVGDSVSNIGVPSVSSNIVSVFGTLGAYTGSVASPALLSIPIAGLTYADGTAVKLSECHGFGSMGYFIQIFTPDTIHYTLPQDSQGMSWLCYSSSPGTGNFNTIMNYGLIAIKTGA